MDNAVDDNQQGTATEALRIGESDADRAPSCPTCQRRLAILNSRLVRNEAGELSRRQLWGCPRGHATAYRTDGVFGVVEVLPALEER